MTALAAVTAAAAVPVAAAAATVAVAAAATVVAAAVTDGGHVGEPMALQAGTTRPGRACWLGARPPRLARRAGCAGSRLDENDDRGGDRGGRFSQTADDLRSRLGVGGSGGSRGAGARRADARGAGARGTAGPDGAGINGAGRNGTGPRGAGRNGRPDTDYWDEPGGGRGAQADGDRPRLGAGGTRTGAIRARVSRDGAVPARGLRRAAPAAAAAYPGDYGDGPVGRTALREQPDFWAERDRTSGGPLPGNGNGNGERPGGHRGGGRGGQGGGRGGGRSGGPDPRSRGERFKDWLLYGSWWRHWSFKKVLAVLGVGAAACFLLFVAAFFIIYNMTLRSRKGVRT